MPTPKAKRDGPAGMDGEQAVPYPVMPAKVVARYVTLNDIPLFPAPILKEKRDPSLRWDD
jgi:hypothetical protein